VNLTLPRHHQHLPSLSQMRARFYVRRNGDTTGHDELRRLCGCVADMTTHTWGLLGWGQPTNTGGIACDGAEPERLWEAS